MTGIDWYYKAYDEIKDISYLKDKIIEKVYRPDDNTFLYFHLSNGDICCLAHNQDCCEDVYLDDAIGDLEDLVGSPVIIAEKRTSDLPRKETWDESYTWTFYEIATIKGSVTLRFYGCSNGYYSEDVDFYVKGK